MEADTEKSNIMTNSTNDSANISMHGQKLDKETTF